MVIRWPILAIAFIWVCSACVGPIEGLYPPKVNEHTISAYVANHNNWHTGIVVRRQDIPRGIWPENDDLGDFNSLEVGWGDRDYYQAEDPTKWIAIKAALWPTQSVLHVVGFNLPVDKFYPEAEIIEIELSSQGLEQLSRYIQDSYARNDSGQVIKLGPGFQENSRFYLARGKFYLPRSCNIWTAKALRAAGCPITPLYAVTAKNVMRQASKFGKTIK